MIFEISIFESRFQNQDFAISPDLASTLRIFHKIFGGDHQNSGIPWSDSFSEAHIAQELRSYTTSKKTVRIFHENNF